MARPYRALGRAEGARTGADGGTGLAAGAERLHLERHQLLAAQQICFRGVFPVQRQPQAARDPEDRLLGLRNGGTGGWPVGWWLDEAGTRRLPALPGAGASVLPGPAAELPPALHALARSRLAFDGGAALWPLELGAVADRPADAQAWLLVRVP